MPQVNAFQLYEDAGDGLPPYFLGSRCEQCGEVVFPAMLDCPACLSRATMRSFRLKGRGRLRDFVVTQRAAPGFRVPYIQAYVQLDDGPMVFSMIDGCEPDASTLRRGDVVEMTIKIIRTVDEVDSMGWTFHPAPTD